MQDETECHTLYQRIVFFRCHVYLLINTLLSCVETYTLCVPNKRHFKPKRVSVCCQQCKISYHALLNRTPYTVRNVLQIWVFTAQSHKQYCHLVKPGSKWSSGERRKNHAFQFCKSLLPCHASLHAWLYALCLPSFHKTRFCACNLESVRCVFRLCCVS